MRTVLMLVSILVISMLGYKGYSGNFRHQDTSQEASNQFTPRDKARDVNRIVLDTANNKKAEIEKQLQ